MTGYEAGVSAALEKYALLGQPSEEEKKPLWRRLLPWLAAGGAGLGAYGLLRKYRPSSIPELLKLQEAAKNTEFEVATSNPIKRNIRSMIFGARDIPHMAESAATASRPASTILHHTPSPGSVRGVANINAGVIPEVLDDKYTFSRLMGDLGTSGGKVPGMPGAIPDTMLLRDALQKVQGDPKRLQSLFGEAGYVIKPRIGALSQVENLLTHETPMNSERLRQAFNNPAQFIIQQKIPIENEYRVHLLNNVPFTATHRRIPDKALRAQWEKYMQTGGGGAFVPVMGDERERLMNFAREATKHLGVNQAGENVFGTAENLHHALDIARLPDGSFKVIESNPWPGTMMNPITARKLQRMATGRWGKDVSALGGLGAAGVAGLGTQAVMNAYDKNEDE